MPKLVNRMWVRILILLGFGPLSFAATVLVPQEFPTIQLAFDASSSGDTVLVAPGVYQEHLIAPNHGILLTSYYPMTRDSSDWLSTVLDGGSTGTALEIETTQGEWFRLKGFVVRNGSGSEQAGGVHCACQEDEIGCRIQLESVMFSENVSHGWTTGALHVSGNTRSLVLNNLVFVNPEFGNLSLVSTLSELALIDSVSFYGNGLTGDPGGFSADSVSCSSIHVEDFLLEQYGKFRVGGFHFAQVDRLVVQNNVSRSGRIASLGSSEGTLRIRNLKFTDNRLERNISDDRDEISLQLSAAHIDIDTLIVERNKTAIEGILSIQQSQDGALQNPPGIVNNLIFRDNQAGDSVNYDMGWNGRLAEIWRCDIRNSFFQNNLSVLPITQPGSGWYARGGALFFWQQENDTVTIENTEFSNNLMLDFDDYSTLPLEQIGGNFGRALYIHFSESAPLTLRNCVFHDNRQNQHCPETDYFYSLGATVYAHMMVGTATLIVEDCSFTDNDDGGLQTYQLGTTLVRNSIFRDNARYGLYLAGNRSQIHNVSVSGTVAQDITNTFLPSKQAPILQFTQPHPPVIRNVTVTGNETESLVHANYQPSPQTLIENSLFRGNTYQQIQAAVGDPEEDLPALFRYCLLPEEVPVGEDNLVGEDPLFHQELGAPWLASVSPCVDAGDPDSERNDREDPENPGIALWPSQGGLRNDIGFTGGPWAQGLDHLVAVEEPAAETPLRPSSLRLEPAAPNPFNPATWLRFHLPQSTDVQLDVYNLRGQRVRQLLHAELQAGEHSLLFDAGELGSGLYLLRLESGGSVATGKVMLIR